MFIFSDIIQTLLHAYRMLSALWSSIFCGPLGWGGGIREKASLLPLTLSQLKLGFEHVPPIER